ncbi:MAG: threonylcarbamoyl-AMP synthase [Planctomycetaceae bacterium]|nr:threonylcarbamoyl-AMP synthase [Planctomycetaceae bacterium]
MAMRISLTDGVAVLKTGGLLAFPTETVYGLGADASNPLAVRQIFAMKGRPADHPLIVHLASSEAVGDWGRLGAVGQALAAAFWPGPLTLVLPRQESVLDEVTGGLQTVGIRVPSHPTAQALLQAFGGGLAAPSANRFGRVSPTTAAHVLSEFKDAVPVLEGGACSIGVESTIIDLSGPPALLRPGGVPVEAIEAITGPLASSSTRAPGTLATHYAPRTALLLSRNPAVDAARLREEGRTVAILAAGEDTEHARRLYAELRRLDDLGVDILIAELAGEGGLGRAINDRLSRAAASREH